MARKLKPCGTTAAAARHRRKGEPLCEKCKRAEAEAKANYRARKKKEAEALTEEAAKKAAEAKISEPINYREELARLNVLLAHKLEETTGNAVAPIAKARLEVLERLDEIDNDNTEKPKTQRTAAFGDIMALRKAVEDNRRLA